jgi:hypothetical protein
VVIFEDEVGVDWELDLFLALFGKAPRMELGFWAAGLQATGGVAFGSRWNARRLGVGQVHVFRCSAALASAGVGTLNPGGGHLVPYGDAQDCVGPPSGWDPTRTYLKRPGKRSGTGTTTGGSAGCQLNGALRRGHWIAHPSDTRTLQLMEVEPRAEKETHISSCSLRPPRYDPGGPEGL